MIVGTVKNLVKLLRENICENTTLSAGSIVEISKLPVLILNGPKLNEKKRLMRDPERITVIDKEAGQAVREIPPRWYDLQFDVNISCNSNLELLDMIAAFSKLNQAEKLITSIRDERERSYLWYWRVMAGADINPNVSQVYQGRGSITIFDVEIYSDIREVIPLIEKINVDINSDIVEVQA